MWKSLAGAAGVIGSAAMLASAAPALAQDNTGQRIAEIIVYGNDPCPRSTDDTVVVCARKGESERYRLPERFRPSGTLQQRQAWAARARSFETVGATGINSCSAVGPGGSTGCLKRIIEQAKAERREEIQGQTPPEQ